MGLETPTTFNNSNQEINIIYIALTQLLWNFFTIDRPWLEWSMQFHNEMVQLATQDITHHLIAFQRL